MLVSNFRTTSRTCYSIQYRQKFAPPKKENILQICATKTALQTFPSRVQQTTHFLYRFLEGKKTTLSQFSVPGLQEIHRNLKQEKKIILASPFLENPLFVLFPA